jgi:hypothetical protein
MVAIEEATPTVISLVAGAPTGEFENALGHSGGFKDMAAVVISPSGGTPSSLTKQMTQHSNLGPIITSLHDPEVVKRFADAILSVGIQDNSSSAEIEIGEACPSVISPTLESFPVVSGFLLQDDSEWVGEDRLPREMSMLIAEPTQEDARGGLA